MQEIGMIGEVQSGISHPVDQPEVEAAPGEYWDDVTGVPSKHKLVRKARRDETQEFAKHGMYTKVPGKRECWAATGKGPIGVRWVDINKGDEDRPEYRSRLVAKELKTGGLICSNPAVGGIEAVDIHGHGGGYRISKREEGTGNEAGIY